MKYNMAHDIQILNAGMNLLVSSNGTIILSDLLGELQYWLSSVDRQHTKILLFAVNIYVQRNRVRNMNMSVLTWYVQEFRVVSLASSLQTPSLVRCVLSIPVQGCPEKSQICFSFYLHWSYWNHWSLAVEDWTDFWDEWRNLSGLRHG